MRCHTRYLRGRRTFPLYLLTAADLSMVDIKFQDFKSLDPPPPPLTRPSHPLWVSSSTIKIIDDRTDLRHNPHHCHNMVKGLTKSVRRSFLEDPRRRAERALNLRQETQTSAGHNNSQNAGTSTRLPERPTIPGTTCLRSPRITPPSTRGRILNPCPTVVHPRLPISY